MSYDSDEVAEIKYLVTEDSETVLVFQRNDGTLVTVPIVGSGGGSTRPLLVGPPGDDSGFAFPNVALHDDGDDLTSDLVMRVAKNAGDGVTGPVIHLMATGGTIAEPTDTTSGDVIGGIEMWTWQDGAPKLFAALLGILGVGSYVDTTGMLTFEAEQEGVEFALAFDAVIIQSGNGPIILVGQAPGQLPTNGVIVEGDTSLAAKGPGSTKLQFFDTTPDHLPIEGAAQQTVTGSRGSNDAVASLLAGLAEYGLIIDDSVEGPSSLDAAVAVTPTTKPNPAWGGDMTVDYASRVDDVVWAFAQPGDDYPRVLFTADGYIFFGNGTYDPYHASETAWIQQNHGTYGGLKIVAADVIEIIAQSFIKLTTQVHFHGNVSFVAGNVITDEIWDSSAHGPVIRAPGGGKWRIVVDDSGNLSTVSVS